MWSPTMLDRCSSVVAKVVRNSSTSTSATAAADDSEPDPPLAVAPAPPPAPTPTAPAPADVGPVVLVAVPPVPSLAVGKLSLVLARRPLRRNMMTGVCCFTAVPLCSASELGTLHLAHCHWHYNVINNLSLRPTRVPNAVADELGWQHGNATCVQAALVHRDH